MKVLHLQQNSKEEKFANRKWNQGTRKFTSNSFDLVAKTYPNCLIEISPEKDPPWGSAYYIDKDDVIELYKEYWDTSG